MTKILIAGDFFPQARVAQLIEKKEYSEVFGDIKSLIESVDYSIVNLECSIVLEAAQPIRKCGPNLRCSSFAAEAIKYAGFKMATLANNHFYDFGEKGVSDTLLTLKSNGLDTVGGGLNLNESQKIFYKHINSKRFAIVNLCEHEFTIATETTGGSNPLNPIVNYYQIKEARKKADYVIVIVHGGHEHYQLPSPRMKETYRFFVDAGADAVVNHHQHCYSGYEIYNKKPIFYGLGNFCFDKNNDIENEWNEGYLLQLNLDSTIDFELYPYIQCGNDSKIKLMTGDRYILFKENIQNLNNIIDNDLALNEKFDDFVLTLEEYIDSAFEPYSNQYLQALRHKFSLPSLFSPKQKLLLKALIQCESHRDILIKTMNNQYFDDKL